MLHKYISTYIFLFKFSIFYSITLKLQITIPTTILLCFNLLFTSYLTMLDLVSELQQITTQTFYCYFIFIWELRSHPSRYEYWNFVVFEAVTYSQELQENKKNDCSFRIFHKITTVVCHTKEIVAYWTIKVMVFNN